MVKRTNDPRELARRRTEKKLSAVGYTPLIARTFSEALLVLAESSKHHKIQVLEAFAAAATQKCPWPIIGKRS